MPAQIYFITQNFLYTNTPIQANVDFKEILPLIKGSADMWTRNTLGTLFYNDLLTKYNAQTLSADETTLVEYIQLSIAWRTAAESVLELSYQITNKGVQTQSGDYSVSLELKYQKYVDKAEFYENRMQSWLLTNKLLFSVFMDDNNKTDSGAHLSLMCKSNNSFISPIQLI